MIDLEYLKAHTAEAEAKLARRGFQVEKLEEVLKLDELRRKNLAQVDKLRAKRNQAAKDRDSKVGKKVKVELTKAEEELARIEELFWAQVLEVPNFPLEDVPEGSPDQFKIISRAGDPTKFSFPVKDHLELGERLGVIDTRTAAKVSGARFSYLKAEAARLELALVNLAWELLIKRGFTPIMPPALIKQEITTKLGYWARGGSENFYLVHNPEHDGEEGGNLYLIGTGEHALVPMHMGDMIPSQDLPKRYVTFTPCFRREAGSYGKDTRGIIRVHQFEKVEMVSFCRPEDSEKEFTILLDAASSLMGELELPTRQVILTAQDLSTPAAKTVDIETWYPSQGAYRETHSISTTTDYQARRLNTKLLAGGRTGFVHILNGTALAIGRTIAALIENNQRQDGSVVIPKSLRRFTGFSEMKPK